MPSDGKYFFALDGRKAFFKLTGTLKYTLGNKFDLFLDNLFDKKPDFENVLIDLSEAVFLDSTNLGFLAKISEFMNENYGKKITIFSQKEDINELLESVGFDEVFVLVKNIDKQEKEFEEISLNANGTNDTNGTNTTRSCSKMMLDAHQALINICKKNSDKFYDVVELLQQSVNKEKKI